MVEDDDEPRDSGVAEGQRPSFSLYSRDTLGNSYVSSDGESTISRSINEPDASHARVRPFLPPEDEAAIFQSMREQMGDGGGYWEFRVDLEITRINL